MRTSSASGRIVGSLGKDLVCCAFLWVSSFIQPLQMAQKQTGHARLSLGRKDQDRAGGDREKGGVLKSSASDFSGKYHNFLMHLPWVRKADCMQGDKDGCQLSPQPVLVTSLAHQRPGGVRAESPLRVMITSHLC